MREGDYKEINKFKGFIVDFAWGVVYAISKGFNCEFGNIDEDPQMVCDKVSGNGYNEIYGIKFIAYNVNASYTAPVALERLTQLLQQVFPPSLEVTDYSISLDAGYGSNEIHAEVSIIFCTLHSGERLMQSYESSFFSENTDLLVDDDIV